MTDRRLLAAVVGPTAFFVVLTLFSIANSGLYRLVAVVDSVLFGLGLLSFAIGFGAAVFRSSRHEISLASAFLLIGNVVSAEDRRILRWILAVQIGFGLLGASWRPFTELAFGALVPMLGIGQIAFFGGLVGDFPVKDSD